MSALDSYWVMYDCCLDRIRDEGNTVSDVIRILKAYWEPSSTEAFFPGGSDRTLVGTLLWERGGWSTVWAEADYYACLQDRDGNRLTYCEGDVSRGNSRPTPSGEPS